MKSMVVRTWALMLSASLMAWPAVLLAAEAMQDAELSDLPAPQEAEVETDYAYGTVTEVAPDRLVVSEYDEERGTTSPVTYLIDPQVVLTDVQAVGEIAVGDEVDIDYVMKDGQRVAMLIAVAQLSEEEADDEPTEY